MTDYVQVDKKELDSLIKSGNLALKSFQILEKILEEINKETWILKDIRMILKDIRDQEKPVYAPTERTFQKPFKDLGHQRTQDDNE